MFEKKQKMEFGNNFNNNFINLFEFIFLYYNNVFYNSKL